MDFPTLRARTMTRLTEMGHGQRVRLLQYAVDLAELHSCLREYVFHTDAKTAAFIREIESNVTTHN